ncbi:hypothetical protein K7X08_035669 [Anisodus acutangulus]|uniref:Uncharacterized protein n=1 Tax=Anisodus acutangulus TaxID=402998 RepID=A0A9Q1RI04_9SOLA|nr:hypothetical protein K7X08_035669 [Anisodus acutangulus]
MGKKVVVICSKGMDKIDDDTNANSVEDNEEAVSLILSIREESVVAIEVNKESGGLHDSTVNDGKKEVVLEDGEINQNSLMPQVEVSVLHKEVQVVHEEVPQTEDSSCESKGD